VNLPRPKSWWASKLHAVSAIKQVTTQGHAARVIQKQASANSPIYYGTDVNRTIAYGVN
jgi:hypothetical protein